MASGVSAKRIQLAALAVVLLGMSAILIWLSRGRVDGFGEQLVRMKGWLGEHPFWLFAALVVAPGLPVPASVLFATAGLAWGDRPPLALGMGGCALLLNQSWTYLLAAGPGRKLAARLLRELRWDLPAERTKNVVEWILLIRLTPGIPLFLQNYYLGLIRVPFLPYLGVSFACSAPIMAGVILTSAGLGGGQWRYGALGAGVLIAGYALLRILRKRKRVDVGRIKIK